MIMKHTEGPWIVEKPYQEPHLYISGPNTQLIACVKDHYENQAGNIRLMSHAPNMYNLLLAIQAAFPGEMERYGFSGLIDDIKEDVEE